MATINKKVAQLLLNLHRRVAIQWKKNLAGKRKSAINTLQTIREDHCKKKYKESRLLPTHTMGW